MNILILGASGAVGYYFIEYLKSINFPMENVYGVGRKYNPEWANYTSMDLAREHNHANIMNLFNDREFGLIFNFASDAVVDNAISNPSDNLVNNIGLMSNVLEWINKYQKQAVLVHISSSEVYGIATNPITENAPYNPVNPYAVSKTTQEMLCDYYSQAYGLKIITFRSFSYLNPRRSDLVLSAFVDRCLQVKSGKIERIFMGNLKSKRTWMDVRDVVELYWKGSQLCEVGEKYNIGPKVQFNQTYDTLRTYTVEELLFMTCELMDIPKDVIFVDRSRYRPLEIKFQIPLTDKFYNVVPSHDLKSLNESLQWLIDERTKINENME